MNPIVKRFKKVRFKLKKATEARLIGAYKTAFKGVGIEIAEVRPYNMGDDIRYIDWNLTAKTGALHVKVFREDRELNVMLLIDLSASHKLANKQNIVWDLATALGYCAYRNQDKIGAIGITDKIEFYFKCARGRNHLLSILDKAQKHYPTSKLTRLETGLEFLQKIQNKRTLVFIISDFIDSTFMSAVKRASRYHEINLFRVFHPLEILPPIKGIFPARELEKNNTFWLFNWRKKNQSTLQEKNSIIENTLAQLQKKHKVNYLSFNCEEDITPPLLHFFYKQGR
jgi:uncharacterized protein (DUF58 family)